MRRPSSWAPVGRPAVSVFFAGLLGASALGFGTVSAQVAPAVLSAPDPTPILGIDDYPYRDALCAPTGRAEGRCPGYAWQVAGEPISPFGFGFRTTTDFVAWRLDQALGGAPGAPAFTWSTLAFPGGDGNAGGWRDGAVASGCRVDGFPERGSVAWWGPGPGTGGGMVAIVTAVNVDGTVDVEEYNLDGTGRHGFRVAVRADAYLHIADQPGPVSRAPETVPPDPVEPAPAPPPTPEPRPDATVASPDRPGGLGGLGG